MENKIPVNPYQMEVSQKSNDRIFRGLNPDSFLGDSSQRYFGNSFKKITHHIDEIRVENNVLSAGFSIQWPVNWSKKNGISLQPHIGTLDFFLIATILAETYFKTVKNIDKNRLSGMWIKEFCCKAGNKSIEENKSNCKCELISESRTLGQTEFSLKMLIADATVILKILLPNEGRSVSVIEPVSSCKHASYYSSGYKDAIRDITNIEVDTRCKRVTANYGITHDKNAIYWGMGSMYMPCITFCDLVLVCGQLSQILLYKLDNATRESSSNLLLRNIRCIYSRPISKNTVVSVEVKKTRMVDLKGLLYNCSDLTFNFNDGDLIAECSSAYQPFHTFIK